MCCEGCASVATLIHESGLENYYSKRTALPSSMEELIDSSNTDLLQVYDDELVQENFVVQDSSQTCKTNLIIQNMHCPTCVWLIENRLNTLPGVNKAAINYKTQILNVKWDTGKTTLSEIIKSVSALGYSVTPYSQSAITKTIETQHRDLLMRLGIAGVFGMQVMVIAVALYASQWSSMELVLEEFFRRASLLLILPVILYAAAPIFAGALRDLKQFSATMDVPVALGLAIAFIASVYTTLTGNGEIYFDSIAMFVFLQLGARFFEKSAFKRMSDRISILTAASPAHANRLLNPNEVNSVQTVAAIRLKPGDFVLVKPGQSVPADGKITNGSTELDESILTGESATVSRKVGQMVIGGSVNVVNSIVVKITNSASKSTLAMIVDLLEDSMSTKPSSKRLSDKIAAKFSITVVSVAICVAIGWYWAGESAWLAHTIAVLVIACPCALSLAVPTALTSTINAGAKYGVLLARPDAAQDLASANVYLFDKTGTLTTSQCELKSLESSCQLSHKQIMEIAGSLAFYSDHPLSKAIYREDTNITSVHNVETVSGGGVCGTINSIDYYLGSRSFVSRNQEIADIHESASHDGPIAYLSDGKEILATFHFENSLRSDAQELIDYLKQSQVEIELVTGDRQQEAQRVSKLLGISKTYWNCSPEEKLNIIGKHQQSGKLVAMVGDGVNDAPTLAAANVSITPADAQQIATAHADVVLLNDQLNLLKIVRKLSMFAMNIIKINVTWAIAYNLIGICLAAAGYIPPLAAAVGMSISSLLVVGNSLRIMSYRPHVN